MKVLIAIKKSSTASEQNNVEIKDGNIQNDSSNQES